MGLAHRLVGAFRRRLMKHPQDSAADRQNYENASPYDLAAALICLVIRFSS